MKVGHGPRLLVEEERLGRSLDHVVRHSRQQRSPQWFTLGESSRQVFPRISQEGQRRYRNDIGTHWCRSENGQLAEGFPWSESEEAMPDPIAGTNDDLDLAPQNHPERRIGLASPEHDVPLGVLDLLTA
jgi:hypothetical protein